MPGLYLTSQKIVSFPPLADVCLDLFLFRLAYLVWVRVWHDTKTSLLSWRGEVLGIAILVAIWAPKIMVTTRISYLGFWKHEFHNINNKSAISHQHFKICTSECTFTRQPIFLYTLWSSSVAPWEIELILVLKQFPKKNRVEWLGVDKVHNVRDMNNAVFILLAWRPYLQVLTLVWLMRSGEDQPLESTTFSKRACRDRFLDGCPHVLNDVAVQTTKFFVEKKMNSDSCRRLKKEDVRSKQQPIILDRTSPCQILGELSSPIGLPRDHTQLWYLIDVWH